MRPEELYRWAADKAERRGLMRAVVEDYRARVRAFVRIQVTEPSWDNGEQVGLVGLIVALEKYDGRGHFWSHASRFVRGYVREWLDPDGDGPDGDDGEPWPDYDELADVVSDWIPLAA